ncbi:MAG: serine hydrolase domain-containing protein [Acidimicrobiales bacterium]
MGALELIDDWPEPHAAAGVLVCGGSTVELVAARGDLDAVAEWASVTKLLVAVAVLVAAERGVLDLDDPAGPPGSTVRHLLSHASGLGPDSTEPLTSPGVRRIYSNAGFEVLARCLEVRPDVQRPEVRPGPGWREVVADTVTGPLGLGATRVPPGGSPASGARGPIRDLLSLASELLLPRTLDADLVLTATEVAFPGLPGVVPGIGRYSDCDWGLGFELKSSKRPHWTATTGSPGTFGHFGRSGAFLWVDPVAGVACASAGGAPFGPWAVEQWPRFSDTVLSEWAGGRRRFGATDA